MTFISLILIALAGLSPVVAENDADVEAIKATIESSYVKGVHEAWDAEAFDAGFNDKFIMFILRDDTVSHFSKQDWKSRMKASDEKRNIKYEIPMVSVEGTAATARIELYRDGKHIFTDFMLLYKVDGKWQITGKVYHSHK